MSALMPLYYEEKPNVKHIERFLHHRDLQVLDNYHVQPNTVKRRKLANTTEDMFAVAQKLKIRPEKDVCLPSLIEHGQAIPNAPRSSWFDDDRQKSDKQTEYLNKLRHLRSQLIDQETENLSNALARFQGKEDNNNKSVSVIRKQVWPAPKRQIRDPIRDAQVILGNERKLKETPTRHLQLMEEKRQRLKRLRRKPEEPKLDAIEGKQLTGREVPNEDWRKTSDSEDSQSSLLQRLCREKDTTPIVFRSNWKPKPKLKLTLDSEFMNGNGEKVVKSLKTGRYHTDRWSVRAPVVMTGHRDEMSISSGYLRYYIKMKHENSLTDRIVAPAPTPLPEDFTLRPFTPPDGVSFEQEPETVTRPGIARRGESESKIEREGRIERENRNEKAFIKLSSKIERENYMKTVRKDELYNNETSFHLPNIAPELETIENRDGKKRHLVVEMPNILFKPATPMSRDGTSEVLLPPEEWRPSRSLTRVMQKHSLREKQVRDLLEDVKDINQVSQQYDLDEY